MVICRWYKLLLVNIQDYLQRKVILTVLSFRKIHPYSLARNSIIQQDICSAYPAIKIRFQIVCRLVDNHRNIVIRQMSLINVTYIYNCVYDKIVQCDTSWQYTSVMQYLIIPVRNNHCTGAVVVAIVWYLDLQLPLQSVPITTNVAISNPAHGTVNVHCIYKYNVLNENIILLIIKNK